jgi:hypothetical protein
MPQSPMTLRMDSVRRHSQRVVEMSQSPTTLRTNYSPSTFIGSSQLPINSPTDGANSKGRVLNAFLTACRCRWNYRRTVKNVKGKAMFVSRNSLSGKPLSKLSCVCLPLGKLVNGKHFPVNEKHFPVNRNTFRSTENTFQSKKNLVWFSGKCFPFWLCLFSGKWFPGNHFPNFPVFVCH